MKRRLFLALSVLLITGCTELQYYKQSVLGHFAVTKNAQPIESLIRGSAIDEPLREKLQTVERARDFAASTLKLPANNSYREFVDLHRGYVLQNLYAADEFSTELVSWCYPIIGCANYRGYFDETMLREEQSRLKDQRLDTYIGQVTAYSTLGWFNDPVLNTFTELPEYRMVGLIFHELAHQEIYLRDDTVFNESFATAVEQAGMAAFYQHREDQETLRQYVEHQRRKQAVVDIGSEARHALAKLYDQPISAELMRARKKEILTQLDTQYGALTNQTANTPAASNPPRFNNARLGLLAAYNDHVAAFTHLLNIHNGDFTAFYATVHELGELDSLEREQCLQQWSTDKTRPTKKPTELCAISAD